MNTEDELENLRKELDELRNENIFLYNELTKQNKTLCEEVISLREKMISLCDGLSKQHQNLAGIYYFCNGYDIRVHLNRLAGMQTADFVTNNLNTVKAFLDRKEYLIPVLNQVDNSNAGQYLEFGVYKGDSINRISKALPNKIIYGFDSFEGLPENWHSHMLKGRFNLNGDLPQVNENVRLIKGWFNETLPQFVKEHPEPCAFIHIDCDLYSSTKTIFSELKNQIVSGTVIAFDEYFNYPGWQEGEYKAFMEFIQENDVDFEYIARTEREQVAVKIK